VNVVNVGAAMVVGDVVVGTGGIVVLIGAGGIVVLVGTAGAVVDTALVGIVKTFNKHIINCVTLND